MTDPEPTAFDTLFRALGDRVDADAGGFLGALAEDFTMEFPHARPGMPERVEGRSNVLAYLAEVGKGVSVDEVTGLVVHETADPDLVILEFDGHGRALRTGERYEQRYVSFIRTRSGKIVHYKDYWNPIQGLKAQLGSAAVDAFLRGGAGGEA